MSLSKTCFTITSVLVLLCCCKASFAQKPVWVNQLAGPGDADAHSCAPAPNGNIYVAGSFSSSLDLDPGAGTAIVNSHGGKDIFLACYDAGGNYTWGISIGGGGDDVVENMTSDDNSNPVIVGKFSGQNIDFDPGGGVKYLHSNGSADGYVAKFNAGGSFAWAFRLGGNTEFDAVHSTTTDEQGNVYIGGNFIGDIDFDPDPLAFATANSTTGTGFVAKYTPGGQYVWGFNFGGGGLSATDNTVWGIKADHAGYIYLVGCFQGANADFDPSASATVLTAAGIYDGYLSKYSTDGVFQFVKVIKGGGIDQVLDIIFDAAGDIYITGFTESFKLDFSGAANFTTPGGGGSGKGDVFIARYDKNGSYKWAKLFGGKGNDMGWGITVADNLLYCTGYFHETIDLDPSAATASYTSKGRNDIFLCKYSLNGDYICGFAIGEEGNDIGRKIRTAVDGKLYLAGLFAEANVNFDPNGNWQLTSQGATDALLAKYEWFSGPPAGGVFKGDTICAGSPAYFTFIANGGEEPFTVAYTDGVDTYTNTGVKSGVPFRLDVDPDTTTIYTFNYIKGDGLCAVPGYPGQQVTVVVFPKPEADAGWDTSVCPGVRVRLQGKGGEAYNWYSYTSQMQGTDTKNPELYIQDSSVCYLVVTNKYGCTDTDAITLTVIAANFIVDSINHLCIGDTLQLHAYGGDIYTWMPADSISEINTAAPFVWVRESKQYKVMINDTVCKRSAILPVDVHVHELPDVYVLVKDKDCGLSSGQLIAQGAATYTWSPADGLDDPFSSAPHASPDFNTVYTVIGKDTWGCKDTVTAELRIFEGQGRLLTPTAFTPNNDGLNDCYTVKIPGALSAYEFSIFNRFGQAVFITDNPSRCWDGRFNGVEQPLGTYFYYYKAKSDVCGDVFGKGDVQLIR